VEETVTRYAACAALQGCSVSCEDTYTTDTVNETLQSYNISIDGDDVDVQILSAIPDGASCQDFSTNLMDTICYLGSCCPGCYNSLEAIAECVVNQVVMPALNRTDTCDFECSGRRAMKTLSKSEPHDRHLNELQLTQGFLGCVQEFFAPALAGNPLQAPVLLFDCVFGELGKVSLAEYRVDTQSTTTSDAASLMNGNFVLYGLFAVLALALTS
jgi:hypothetical protein